MGENQERRLTCPRCGSLNYHETLYGGGDGLKQECRSCDYLMCWRIGAGFVRLVEQTRPMPTMVVMVEDTARMVKEVRWPKR